MKRSYITAMVLAFVAGGLVTGAAERWAGGTRIASASPNTGHYQLTVDHDSQWLLDTDSGRVWFRYGTGPSQWTEQSPDYTLPPKVAK